MPTLVDLALQILQHESAGLKYPVLIYCIRIMLWKNKYACQSLFILERACQKLCERNDEAQLQFINMFPLLPAFQDST